MNNGRKLSFEDLNNYDTTLHAGEVVAKYNLITESFRHNIPEASMCALFCGGRNCKYESVTKWPQNDQAIDGIYSTWVTPNILAMARPNQNIVENLIKEFKKEKIKSIFNLQTPGEHSSCGLNLQDGGFSYSVKTIMDNNIDFYNFPWQDYSFGTLSEMCDIVKVIQYAISIGKIAIHCHAGLGRTGVLIACYLIYANRLEADEAIKYVRMKRPGSIQTSTQLQFVRRFANYLKPLRIVFRIDNNRKSAFTLSDFLNRQKLLIHGNEYKMLRYIPKIVYVCCNKLLELAGHQCNVEEHHSRLIIIKSRLVDSFKNNKDNDSTSSEELTLNRSSSTQSLKNLRESFSINSTPKLKVLDNLKNKYDNESDLYSKKSNKSDFSIKNKSSVSKYKDQTDLNFKNITSSSKNSHKSESKTKFSNTSKKSHFSNKDVAESMLLIDYKKEVLEAANQHRDDVNNHRGGWANLKNEEKPEVLSCLLWSWLEELWEPIISDQDLQMINDIDLKLLDKGSQQTIFYLMYTLCALDPLPPQSRIRTALKARLLKALIHQPTNSTFDMDVMAASGTLHSNEVGMATLRRSVDANKDVASILDEIENYIMNEYLCICIRKK